MNDVMQILALKQILRELENTQDYTDELFTDKRGGAVWLWRPEPLNMPRFAVPLRVYVQAVKGAYARVTVFMQHDTFVMWHVPTAELRMKAGK
jgi:hypothetical protein